jgi:pyochelin synthetase
MTAIGVPPVDPRVYAVLAEAGFGDELFNPRQHRSCELVERYTLETAVALTETLGLPALLAVPRTVDALLDARGFATAFRAPLAWLLARLAAAGLLARDGDAYRLAAPLPPPAVAAVRAACLETDPAYAPALDLVDEAAAIYPRVAAGETSGERALFQRVALWVAYFNNAHPYYALNNRVAAQAAAARVGDADVRVLEVGAGLGSATEALLDALAARGRLGALARYDATEPVVFFRRRAARTLAAAHSGVPLAFGDLDLDRPWAAQGVEPGRLGLVWGVNVFHLARDLGAALDEAHAALAPGGWLVLGEGIRPAPGRPVAAEMPFQLLERFADVALDPDVRPTPGFLTAEQWQRALERAGFADVALVPDVVRLRALYPGFFAAAVCGRRPASAAASARPTR